MFTGLIECVGEIAEVETRTAGQRLHLRAPLASALAAGESLAVNGVCLTVTVSGADRLHADIGPETARVTTLGSMRPGQRVNLERAMRADSRFGGHFVQGHVDGTGTVRQVRPEGEAFWITIASTDELAPYLIRKGSIAVDGVSLTIADLRDGEFDVMIIPFTWAHTNLSALVPGSRVNLECDMVGKYVARAAELAAAGRLKAAPTT
ncbi:MAG TPA: riboflavin synthase [Vicinamibacterales bacterium]